VVVAPRVAELVYKANLKLLPLVAVKLCVPVSNSTLKLVVSVDDIAILNTFNYFC
jgi:hypothetical protein